MNGLHQAAPPSQHFADGAKIIVVHFQEELFDGFSTAVFTILKNHFGAANGKLVPFAAHRLDEDGQMQLTAPRDDKFARLFGFFHAHGDVAFQLAQQSFPNLAAGDKFAFFTGKRAVVYAEGHAYGGFFYLDGGQRTWIVRIG